MPPKSPSVERIEARKVTPSEQLATRIRATFGGVRPDQLLVVSDFDGTLSEIVPQAGEARPVAGALEALAELAASARRVVMLSGRSPDALRRVVPISNVLLLGDYGLLDPSAEERDALAAFNAEASGVLEGFPRATLETKPGSSSVHFRGVPDSGEEIFQRVDEVARRHGLRAHRGRMVVEVRPERAEKAGALRRLVDEYSPGAAVFAGDDEGDRGVFEVVSRLPFPHLAVGVRSTESRSDLFDDCDLVVDGPREAVRFFSLLARWAAEPGRADP